LTSHHYYSNLLSRVLVILAFIVYSSKASIFAFLSSRVT
jgi:hypothetical protein